MSKKACVSCRCWNRTDTMSHYISKKEFEKSETDCLKLISERDFREEQINQIANALGDRTEWTLR